jgi:L-asparaginase
MAYTAAALSYLVQRSAKPVVVTGAQRPIDLDVTDARQNLADAILFAATPGARDVSIVFDGKVIAGTRARKERTHSFNAFSSMNFPYLATIQNGRVIFYLPPAEKDDAPCFFRELDTKVALVKLVPGVDAGLLEYACRENDAVVVESFGVGGLPTNALVDAPKIFSAACAAGKTVVMTTQVPLEGSNMSVYEVGRAIVETPGMLEAFDMTIEATLCKLMWILGLTREHDRIARLFHTTVNHDTLFT